MVTGDRVLVPAAGRRDSNRTRERLGAASGIVFALLFAFAITTLADIPVHDESDAELLAYYADSGNRGTAITCVYLLALSGVVFLWFLGQLRGVLRRGEGEPGTLANIGFASGLVFTAMLFAGSAALGAVAAAMEWGDVAQPSADISRMLPQLGWQMLGIFGMFAAGSFIVATSILAWRTGVLPRWLAWTGFVCTAVLLFSVVFFPMIAFVVWIIAVSVVLFRRGATTQPGERTLPGPA